MHRPRLPWFEHTRTNLQISRNGKCQTARTVVRVEAPKYLYYRVAAVR